MGRACRGDTLMTGQPRRLVGPRQSSAALLFALWGSLSSPVNAATEAERHIEGFDGKPVVITVSKAGDGLGAPVDLRPSGWAGTARAGAIMRPGQLPLAAASLTSRFGMRVHPTLGG